LAIFLDLKIIYCKIIPYSPLAQLVERVAVKGSSRGKPRLELRANSGKSHWDNPELNSRDFRDKCAETIYPPPKAKATEKR
jgi:hypothetical protein